MSLKTVLCEKSDGVFSISLNRPRVLNALNEQLISDLFEALKAVEIDVETKVVILKGEGRAFCAGADLSGEGDSYRRDVPIEQNRYTIQDISRVMLGMTKIIVAAVKGYAIGAGLEIAMCADLRIVAEGTKFGSTETSVGETVTNAGTKLLTYYVGLGRAKEMYFTNEFIDAKEAYQYGLANKIVALSDLDKIAMTTAKKIRDNSGLSLMLTKAAVNRALGMSLEDTLAMETRDIQINTLTPRQRLYAQEAMKRLQAKK
jgi:enoyl-CoA hydratase